MPEPSARLGAVDLSEQSLAFGQPLEGPLFPARCQGPHPATQGWSTPCCELGSDTRASFSPKAELGPQCITERCSRHQNTQV